MRAAGEVAGETFMTSSGNTTTSDSSRPVLTIEGLSKHFGGTKALDDVNLCINAGEIHALLGANGAGKSTLIKILAGVYKPDHGEITFHGALRSGLAEPKRISFVHQDLGLIDSMTIGENMAMTYGYPTRRGLIAWKAVDESARSALRTLGAPLPMNRLVGELSQAEKSMVAIARALTRDVEVLVLDEPTASLPEADVGRLFSMLRLLKARDVGVVYVSHRLDEVFRLADAATVLRDGRVVANYRPVDVPPERLVADICGKVPAPHASLARRKQSPSAIQVSDLCIRHIGPVTFEVGANEILGLAGLRGQGHEAIGRAIAGVQPASSGEIRVKNTVIRLTSPKVAIAAGIGFATSKRAGEGLALQMKVRENLFLNPFNFGRRPLSFRTSRQESLDAATILNRFDVRPRDPERDITTLSGGNQQKVIMARLIRKEYEVLVLEEPTIGVDVGAKAEIYRILTADAARGTACIVVSSDLDELVQICDRVLAFRAGRIVSELRREKLTVEALTNEISGATTPVAATPMMEASG
jgi:ribose transport system ATP-binding protein